MADDWRYHHYRTVRYRKHLAPHTAQRIKSRGLVAWLPSTWRSNGSLFRQWRWDGMGLSHVKCLENNTISKTTTNQMKHPWYTFPINYSHMKFSRNSHMTWSPFSHVAESIYRWLNPLVWWLNIGVSWNGATPIAGCFFQRTPHLWMDDDWGYAHSPQIC